MNNPLVSIIIPTFNRAHLIVETLDSISAQTYKKWECIVVDDGSSDETEKILNEYVKNDARFQYHKRPDDRQKGANACRNFGIKICKGDYLIFFDSDDLMISECISLRVNYVTNNHDYDFVVFSYGILSKGKRVLKKNQYSTDCRKMIKGFLYGNMELWTILSPIYRTNFIKNKIWFNEKLNRLQDIEFHLKLLYNSNTKYNYVNSTDVFYRSNYEEENKYLNTKFQIKIIENFHELLISLFKIFDNNFIIEVELGFYELFKRMIILYPKGFTYNFFYKIVRLYNKKMRIPYSKMIVLFLLFICKKNPKTKGSYRLAKFLEEK